MEISPVRESSLRTVMARRMIVGLAYSSLLLTLAGAAGADSPADRESKTVHTLFDTE
jgi:hypothetical protein